MFHLRHFQQHHWFYGPRCDTFCVVCQKNEPLANLPDPVIQLAKTGDILNISATVIDHGLMDQLMLAKTKGLFRRLWFTHRVDQIRPDILTKCVDELMVWCPAPEENEFNHRCGREFFEEFKWHVKRVNIRTTCVFPILQMNMAELPEFYDLVDELNAFGLILYCPKAFNREERHYITRFKRVPRMRILSIKDAPLHSFLGTPNTMGGGAFEWADWCYAMRKTLRQWPLIKHTL